MNICSCVFLLFYLRKQKWLSSCLGICTIAVLLMSLQNVTKINKEYKEYLAVAINNEILSDEIKPFFNFSKTKQNVVVIMLDRAISSYFEEVLKYDPSLKQKFSGFTYYPNTASFAGHTLMGAPGLWGGYEYTPVEMNKQSDIPLVDKHNEALKIMPTIFKSAGYDVAFSDPSLAGYKWIPDTTVLSKIGVKSENLQERYIKKYTSEVLELSNDTVSAIKRDLLCFSLFRELPLIGRLFIYDKGEYLNVERRKGTFDKLFIGNCAQLDYLPQLCSYDSDSNNIMLMENQLPHSNQDIKITMAFLNKMDKYKSLNGYNFSYKPSSFSRRYFFLNVLLQTQ